MRIPEVLVALGKLTLATILAAAACAKLVSPESFQASLESFKLFPKDILPYLATFVPTLELLTATLLVLRGKALQGVILSTALACGFTLSLLWGIITKSVKECGCFGQWEMGAVSPEMALARAVGILTLSALLTIKLLKRTPK
jgi:hypothetical protein